MLLGVRKNARNRVTISKSEDTAASGALVEIDEANRMSYQREEITVSLLRSQEQSRQPKYYSQAYAGQIRDNFGGHLQRSKTARRERHGGRG